MSVADEPLNETDLTTFATRTREDRSRQAKKQARDRFGRWISVGANVQWRHNGTDYSGTVNSLGDDSAVVSVKNSADPNAKMTVSQKDLKVTTSKATLADTDVPKMADEDTNKEAVDRPEFNESLDLNGSASIKRDDGYIIEAQKEVDTDGNPIMYQLYAPNGRSLGIYGAEALEDFDRMIAEDKATGEDKIIDENGEIVPVTPEIALPGGPVAASGQVIRIARDHSSVIVLKNNVYHLIETDSGDTVEESDILSSLTAGGSWRKSLPTEKELSTHLISENDVEFAITSLAQYRVPNAVREAITAAITTFENANISEDDLDHIQTLANDELVSLDSIKWIDQFFSSNENPEKLHGGYQGKKWASKILAGQAVEETENKSSIVYDNFDDDIFVYFGIGRTEESGTAINALMSADLETDAVYEWNQGKFNLTELSTDDVEAPTLIVLDAESAKTVAKWIDIANGETAMDVLDIEPEERNLFSLAYPELDFEEIDRVSALIADATGYSPAERSVNAQRQKRGPGGKFGGEQVEQSSTLAEGIVKKATLSEELPLVQDVGQLIKDWLLMSEDFGGVVAAGELFSFSPEDLASFADITEADVMPTAPEEAPVAPVQEEETTTESDPNSGNILYFAIVDPVDKTAVTDVVALIKQDSQPAAWLRSGGTWIKSSEKLSDLQGATPPPVVKLGTPEPVKTVLSQVDSYDNEKGINTQEMPIAASGCSLFDGTLNITNENDLVNSVFTIVELPDSEYALKARYHIRKRARALNRMDLVPVEWRELSLTEIGTIENSSSPLYGEYGEVITASGVKGIADTPTDFRNVARLKTYWATGKGAAKIRWGTPGDLTRAHRYLAKYVGPMRAWGLAQNIHKMVMGVPNITHDRATGQYRPRGKKR